MADEFRGEKALIAAPDLPPWENAGKIPLGQSKWTHGSL